MKKIILYFVFCFLICTAMVGCTNSDKSTLNIEEKNSENITVNKSDNLIALSEIWMYSKQLSPFWNEERINEWDKLYEQSINKLLNYNNSGNNQYKVYEVFEEFISFLEDGHVGIFPSQNQADNIGFIPYFFSYYDGRYYITSKSIDADIPLGSEVIEINNIPIDTYILQLDKKVGLKTKGAYENSASQRISYNKFNSSINITFISSKTGERETVELLYNIKYNEAYNMELDVLQYEYFSNNPIYSSSNYWITSFDSTIYLWISSFGDDNMVIEFYNNVLPIINKYDNLIIDIRNNNGGNANNGKLILELLSGVKVADGKAFAQYNNVYDIAVASLSKLGKIELKDNIAGYNMLINSNIIDANELNISTYKETTLSSLGINIYNLFKGKIGILTSYRTASAAEDFVMFAKQLKQCKVYGTNTKGATGQIACFGLKNKMLFTLSVLDYRTNEGNKIQNVGIEPDFHVEQDMQSFINGIDNQLNYVIKNMNGE